MTPSTARQLDRLAAQYARLERLAALDDEHLTAAREERSAWSPAQHLFHVLLANELSLENAAALVAGKGLLVRPCEGLAEGAEEVLARGTIERGTAQAPRFVRPRAAVDLVFVRELVGSTRAQLDALDPVAVDAAEACIPHQVLGDLSAARWVRFARMHTAHHVAIVRDLLRA